MTDTLNLYEGASKQAGGSVQGAQNLYDGASKLEAPGTSRATLTGGRGFKPDVGPSAPRPRSPKNGASPQAAPSHQQRARNAYGLKDYEHRSMFLPMAQTHEGELEFALPGIIAGPLESSALPGHVLEGGSYTSEDATRFALDILTPATGKGRPGTTVARPNMKDPAELARRQMVEAMQRDQMTPEQIRARAERLGPQGTIADAGGENMRGLARATAGTPGPSKERARSIFNTRAFGEGSRVKRALQETTNAQDYFSSRDELLSTLRGRAGQKYQTAYEAGPSLQSDKLTELLSRDVSKAALKEAQDLAAIDGRQVVVPPQGISTETLDDLKRGFDSLLDSPAYRGQFGGMNKKGTALNNLKNEILAEADRLNPAYRQARQAYRGDAEMLNALELGSTIKRMSAQEVKRALSNMTEAERQAFRNGAVTELIRDISKTGDRRSVAQKLGGNREMREKMRALIPDSQDFRDFTRLLVQESHFQNTRNRVLGGSQTAPRLAEAADASRVGESMASAAIDAAGEVATGGSGVVPGARLAARTAKSLIPGATGRAKAQEELRAATGRELGPRLFNRDAAANEATLRALEQPSLQPGLTRHVARNAPAAAGDAAVALTGPIFAGDPFQTEPTPDQQLAKALSRARQQRAGEAAQSQQYQDLLHAILNRRAGDL